MKRSLLSFCCGFLLGCTGLNPEFADADTDTDGASASQTDAASGPTSPSGSDTAVTASGSSDPTSDSDSSTGADTSGVTTGPSNSTGPSSDCPGDKVCVELPQDWEGPIYGPDMAVDPTTCPGGLAPEVIWGRGALPTCECTDGSFGACSFDVVSFSNDGCTEGLEAPFVLDGVMPGCYAVEGEEDVAAVEVSASAEAACPQPHPQFPERFPRCETAALNCGSQGICNSGEPICLWRAGEHDCPGDWSRTVYHEKLSCNCTPTPLVADCLPTSSMHSDETCETTALNAWSGGSCTGAGEENTLFINLSEQTQPPNEPVSCASANADNVAVPVNPVTVCCR